MIISQIIFPDTAVDKSPKKTDWKSMSQIIKWGSECNRKVLVQKENILVVMIPYNQDYTEIIKYHKL